MSHTFDAYHKWLGIPPEEQPPNHYRLLGLPPLEDDPDVIEHAADQRMSHLRTLQVGRRAELSQRLLNDVAAARVVLSNPEKKAAYDATLRQELEAQAAGPVEPELAGLFEQTAPAASPVARRAVPRKKSLGQGPIVGTVAVAGLLVLGLLVWVLSSGRKPPNETAATPKSPRETTVRDRHQPDPPPPPPPADPPPKPPDEPAGDQPPTPEEATVEALIEQGKLSENLLKPDRWGVRGDSKLPFDRQGELFVGDNGTDTSLRRSALQQVLLNQASAEPIVATLWSKAEGVSGKADPNYSLYLEFVHTDGTHASARSVKFDVATHDWQRRELLVTPEKPLKKMFVNILFSHHGGKVWFRDPELRVVRPPSVETPVVAETPQTTEPEPQTPEEKEKLPIPSQTDQEKITKQLSEVYKIADLKRPSEKRKLAGELLELGKKSEEPAERFTVLRKAMELARDAGDAAQMLEAIDAIGVDFQVDVLGVKEKMLVSFAGDVTTSTEIESFVEASTGVMDQAMAEDRYELAANLADRAYALCRKPQGRKFRKQAHDRRIEVQKLYESWKEVRDALAKLKEDPENPAANLAAGRWYCFEKADWPRGLPYLARSGDAKLKSLAAQELESPPDEPADQLKLADAWWDLAEKRSDNEKDSLRLRAGCWYKAIGGELTSSLTKAKVEKRLAEIAKLGRPIPDAPNRRPQPEQTAAADAPAPAVEKPAPDETLIAEDEHKGHAGDIHHNATYVLRGSEPTVLGKTAIRFKALAGQNESQGKVLLSLDGVKWAPLGVWTDATCAVAQVHTQNWQTLSFPSTYREKQAKELHVRFQYERGNERLDISRVEWVRSTRPTADAPGPEVEKPAETPAPDAQPGESFALNRWVDLLESVDFGRDRVEGKWKRMRDKLLVTPSGCARMMLPVKVEGEYDLEVAFSRTAGNGPVAIILPVGPRLCQFVLDDYSGHKSGIDLIGGENRSENSTGKSTDKLASKKVYTMLLSVRSQGETAGVEVSLEGEQILRWAGKRSLLSVPLKWMLPEFNRPALAALENTTVFESARLRVVSGQASPVPRDGKSVKPPARRFMSLPTVVNLFGLDRSKWKVEGDHLKGDPGSFDVAVAQETHSLAGISNRGLTMASRPVATFEFGFKIKAKHYQTIRVYIDGCRYYYARGGYENTCTRIMVDKQNIRHDRKISSADQWCSLTAAMEGDTLKFYYNEQLEYECKVPEGTGGKHVIHVGFASHWGPIYVKDFYLEMK